MFTGNYFVLSFGMFHFWSSYIFVHVVFMIWLVEPAFFELFDGVDFFFSSWKWRNFGFKTHCNQLKIIISLFKKLISLKFIKHNIDSISKKL
jgi:hypothetical protein